MTTNYIRHTAEQVEIIRKAMIFEELAIRGDTYAPRATCRPNPFLRTIRTWPDGAAVEEAINEYIATWVRV